MATTTTKPDMDVTTSFDGGSVSAGARGEHVPRLPNVGEEDPPKRSPQDALQALLAFSALHAQVRRRKALASRSAAFDAGASIPEFEADEQFVLDEVLQLVAERAVAITGADGLAIALAENDEIVLRAAAGVVRPDVGARIDRDSAFSGACFRSAQIVTCDDTETDLRVNVEACRKLGARSMIAVPLCGRRRVIGVLEAFFAWPFGFNESDIRNLSMLAELVLGALKPEDEDRFAESAQVAAIKLEAPPAAKTPATETFPVAASQIPARPTTSSEPIPTAKPPARDPKVDVPPTPNKPAEKPAIESKAVPVAQEKKAESTKAEAKPAESKTSSGETKSAEPKVVSAAPENKAEANGDATPAAILDKSSSGKPATSGISIATEMPTIASVPAAEQEAPKRKPLSLFLLVGVVVVAAFGAGIWWKLKTAQLGDAMIHTEKPAVLQPQSDAKKESTPTTAPGNAVSTPASATPDVPEPSASMNSPATAQELAKFPHITGVRHWSSADSSTIVLDLEDQVQYEAHRITGPDRIYFDLRDTQLAPELVGKSIEVGDAFVSRIRMAQPVAGMTRIVLDTKPNSTFSVSLEPNPYRLVVEVRKIGASPKAEVNLFPNAPEGAKRLAIVIPPPTKEDLQLRARVPKMRIVVDAGHGGWDLGTVGRRGLLEKDLVLEIAQRLGKLLESRLGAEVVYTRQDDNYIPLDERASIANQAQADLFVSVHANYSDLPSARGVETYYTNFFTAPGTREPGSKDPGPKISGVSAAGSLMKNVAAPTLSPADLHERTEQSRRLAASVQRSLYGTLSIQNPGLRDRGIKEAGFVVLTESAMPGILAEVSFVSSPTDEQKLRSDGYREQIAEALYRGIARYAASSKNVKMASARD